VIPNREFIPNPVVTRNEEAEQYDPGERGRSHPALVDPCSHKSCAESRDGSQNEAGQLHCERKIEGDFGLMVVWPQGAQSQIYHGGDKKPGDQGRNDGAQGLQDRMAAGARIKLSVWQRYSFHISLIIVLQLEYESRIFHPWYPSPR